MIKDMTAAEIKAEIKELETTSRERLRYLRALLRVVESQGAEHDSEA